LLAVPERTIIDGRGSNVASAAAATASSQSAIVGGVLRRPLLWGALATALLIALAIPALRGGRGWDRVGAARPREAPSQVPGGPFAAPATQTSLREGTADSPRARGRCARGSVRG
jgi:hypothetical protein